MASIRGNIIEIVEHVFHQIRISSPDNYVEDDGISDITKSTSETNPSKSDPSSLLNQTQIIKVAHFHQLKYHTWQIVASDKLDGVSEDKNRKSTSQIPKPKFPSPKHHDFKNKNI